MFQECDTVGITRPCTKHNVLVRDVLAKPFTLTALRAVVRDALAA